ncbi:MAG: zinc transport system substrate-binding protein [Actinomycetota bacterium]|jgi:zinc transport system substrate-binding protein
MKYVALALALFAAACSSTPKSGDGKLTVVANFFPVAEAAQQVGGDLVKVTNLTPAGVEPHDLELTTDDVDRIQDASVVFYVGSGFQPGVAEAANRRSAPSIDVAKDVLTKHEGDETDPHFWLDPLLMIKAVDAIEAGLARVDRENAATFRANAAAYKVRLAALDSAYSDTLRTCARREIVTAHAAFAYLADRYALQQVAVTGVSPESEADPQRIAELSDLIKRDGVTTVFYEELVPRDFADVLANEAGVKTAVLNPLEGLTKKEQKAGKDYAAVMRTNLRALADALACTPAAP